MKNTKIHFNVGDKFSYGGRIYTILEKTTDINYANSTGGNFSERIGFNTYYRRDSGVNNGWMTDDCHVVNNAVLIKKPLYKIF